MNLEVETFVFDDPAAQRSPSSSSSSGLKMTAKRYKRPSSRSKHHLGGNDPSRGGDDVGLTLLFTHCIGAHKEQWEPTIQAIFNNSLCSDTTKHAQIREAWAFDWQSHGEAAVLNRDALRQRKDLCVSIYEWAAAISAFVKSDYIEGHTIVLIGHSAGAGTMILTTKDLPPQPLHYAALILVEPTIITKELFETTIDDRMDQMEFAVQMTATRRDSWSSREDAFTWLSKKYPWSTWDSRVVRLLVDHGTEHTSNGIRLKCERKQEAASYSDVEGHFEAAMLMSNICPTLPVHVIWGENPDLVSDDIRESLSDASVGRTVASVRKIGDAGHMVVQEKPDALAQAISQTLDRYHVASQLRQTKL